MSYDMDPQQTAPGDTYCLRIIGVPNHSLAGWLDDFTIIPQEHGQTTIIGKFADQAALRGLLDQIWNLNMVVLLVERIEHEDKPNSHP
jgi:hypothetical protein